MLNFGGTDERNRKVERQRKMRGRENRTE